MNIEMIEVSELHGFENNPRKHSPEQIEIIANSIDKFGFNNPILIDDEKMIIAGHGRLEASKKLNLEKVPVIRLSHLSNEEKKAFIIAENKSFEQGEWDDQALVLLIQELEESELFDSEAFGFTAKEMEALNSLIESEDFPDLPDGDKEPFQQMTFTLHDDQAEIVKEAIDLSKSFGEFVDSINENSNGNAFARICETFITQNRNLGNS